MKTPQYLFEISWEVCQKVGGIHTVLSSKAPIIQQQLKLGNNFIFIGPDLWREDKKNPEFTEDPNLFSQWKQQAESEGLRIKIGHWNISQPQIAILVDFTTLFSRKDEIFTELWDTYELDSISGQWDYVEPALFGYAAGIVIESFINFNLHIRERSIAHFHEWMTGAGILYLKKYAPQVGRVFTTHATVLGRSLAGNNRCLYNNLENFQPDLAAKEFNVVSKHSLEKKAAANSDCFTTVSEITASECEKMLGFRPDVVTPNGYNLDIVLPAHAIDDTRKNSRKLLLKLAHVLYGDFSDEHTLIVGTSGRYEFRNKGIDMFIDSMCMAAKQKSNINFLAYVMVPAYNLGPDKEIQSLMESEYPQHKLSSNRICTHLLHDYENDPLVRRLALCNIPQNLMFVFVPSYFDGNDGILNKSYYEVLPGLDLTLFPSYYEPWGYTPLESVAFYVPTATTSLAGFGAWIKQHYPAGNKSCYVVERDDMNYSNATESLVEFVLHIASLINGKYADLRLQAYETAKIALWQNLIKHYYDAFEMSLDKIEARKDSFTNLKQTGFIPKVKFEANQPDWQSIEVAATLPKEFEKLREISMNVWWSWNCKAIELFEYIDSSLWEKWRYNPITLLKDVAENRYAELLKDEKFLKAYHDLSKEFDEYMAVADRPKPPRIAYFSMEYGLNDNIKIFSGGLGILAGDYMKEASESNVDMFGVGLLYRHGYFKQNLSIHGDQLSEYYPQNFSNLPITATKDEDDNWLEVSVVFPGRTIFARVWTVNVGRIKMYLLDTDYEKNSEVDRKITHQLYGGDNENRLKQEMILGIGGIRLIRSLKLKPELYHINEGHAAFISLERLRVLMREKGFTFAESVDYIRSTSLFTTHTPVPAGHDAFDEDLMRTYMSHYPERFNMSWEDFLHLGKADNSDKKFSMSYLAANFAQEINGVSMLHGEVSREIFQHLYKNFLKEELHISYVTNGVHYKTWTAPAWQNLYEKYLGSNVDAWLSDSDLWKPLVNIPNNEIWNLRQSQRQILIDYLHKRIKKHWVNRYENPKNMITVLENLNPKALTIVFARRFATYKRAHLLFTNLKRLSDIVNNKERPVQFIFAGKAHPNDKAGQDLIKKIIEISRMPEFLGKIIFLENYDISLAQKLVQGADIWLNTPTRPLEASGTSGMKAVLNGVLHYSVVDGWWVEGYKKGAGWALPQQRTYKNQDFQDELDSESIYLTFENEIIPMFYERNNAGVPDEWVSFIKKSISEVAPQFTTRRMMQDYYSRFYNKLYKRSQLLKADSNAKLEELYKWKKYVLSKWNDVRMVNVQTEKTIHEPAQTGDVIKMNVAMNLNGLKPEDVRLELVVTENFITWRQLLTIEQAKWVGVSNGIDEFEICTRLFEPGTINYALRILPDHELLPHKADFNIVKWL